PPTAGAAHAARGAAGRRKPRTRRRADGRQARPVSRTAPPPQRGGALGWGVYPPPRSSTAPPRPSQPPAAARREEPATPARAARRRRPNAPSRPNSARVQPPTAMLNGSGCYREPTSRPMTDAPNDSIAVRLDAVRLDRGPRTILSGIDLSVPRGSVTAVLGPSGSGKSTLLAALTGELVPASGTVEVFGQPVPRRMRDLLALRKSIGVLLQGNGLLTDLTAAENIALPLRTHTRLPREVIDRLVEMKLHAVGLRAAANLYPRELSGGMARRVALARAIALDPPLMVYDEPLTGLDPIASGVIMNLVSELND